MPLSLAFYRMEAAQSWRPLRLIHSHRHTHCKGRPTRLKLHNESSCGSVPKRRAALQREGCLFVFCFLKKVSRLKQRHYAELMWQTVISIYLIYKWLFLIFQIILLVLSQRIYISPAPWIICIFVFYSFHWAYSSACTSHFNTRGIKIKPNFSLKHQKL